MRASHGLPQRVHRWNHVEGPPSMRTGAWQQWDCGVGAFAVADGHAVGLLLIAASEVGLTLAAAFTTGGSCLGHWMDPAPGRFSMQCICRSVRELPR